MKQGKWTNQNSIALSRVCVTVIMLCLIAVDLGGVKLADWFLEYRREELGGLAHGKEILLLSLYAVSVPAWVVVFQLRKLLKNVAANKVFTAENVAALRLISWCGAAATAVCVLSGCYYAPCFLPGAAAGFVALLVRVVKNCFQQAVEMKNELDYTV